LETGPDAGWNENILGQTAQGVGPAGFGPGRVVSLAATIWFGKNKEMNKKRFVILFVLALIAGVAMAPVLPAMAAQDDGAGLSGMELLAEEEPVDEEPVDEYPADEEPVDEYPAEEEPIEEAPEEQPVS